MHESNVSWPNACSLEQGKYAKAMTGLTKDLATIEFDQSNTYFKSKYASYAHICNVLHPILVKHGFRMPKYDCVSHVPTGELWMLGKMTHKSGEWDQTGWPLFNPDGPQTAMSARTTAMRVLILNLTGAWVGEYDDDGNYSLEENKKPKQGGKVQKKDYEQMAMLAIDKADSAEKAADMLAQVELRAREGAVSKEVLKRCKDFYIKKWSK